VLHRVQLYLGAEYLDETHDSVDGIPGGRAGMGSQVEQLHGGSGEVAAHAQTEAFVTAERDRAIPESVHVGLADMAQAEIARACIAAQIFGRLFDQVPAITTHGFDDAFGP